MKKYSVQTQNGICTIGKKLLFCEPDIFRFRFRSEYQRGKIVIAGMQLEK